MGGFVPFSKSAVWSHLKSVVLSCPKPGEILLEWKQNRKITFSLILIQVIHTLTASSNWLSESPHHSVFMRKHYIFFQMNLTTIKTNRVRNVQSWRMLFGRKHGKTMLGCPCPTFLYKETTSTHFYANSRCIAFIWRHGSYIFAQHYNHAYHQPTEWLQSAFFPTFPKAIILTERNSGTCITSESTKLTSAPLQMLHCANLCNSANFVRMTSRKTEGVPFIITLRFTLGDTKSRFSQDLRQPIRIIHHQHEQLWRHVDFSWNSKTRFSKSTSDLLVITATN